MQKVETISKHQHETKYLPGGDALLTSKRFIGFLTRRREFSSNITSVQVYRRLYLTLL